MAMLIRKSGKSFQEQRRTVASSLALQDPRPSLLGAGPHKDGEDRLRRLLVAIYDAFPVVRRRPGMRVQVIGRLIGLAIANVPTGITTLRGATSISLRYRRSHVEYLEPYIDKPTDSYDRGDAYPRYTPTDVGILRLQKLPDDQHLDDRALNRYQTIVDKLLYPASQLRVDIAFHVAFLARGMSRPTPRHSAEDCRHRCIESMFCWIGNMWHTGVRQCCIEFGVAIG
jgi:hypothetical protein